MKNGKEIVVEFVNATNERDWDKVMSLFHPDFVRHSSSEPKEISTNNGLVGFHKIELKSFPDLQEKVLFAFE